MYASLLSVKRERSSSSSSSSAFSGVSVTAIGQHALAAPGGFETLFKCDPADAIIIIV